MRNLFNRSSQCWSATGDRFTTVFTIYSLKSEAQKLVKVDSLYIFNTKIYICFLNHLIGVNCWDNFLWISNILLPYTKGTHSQLYLKSHLLKWRQSGHPEATQLLRGTRINNCLFIIATSLSWRAIKAIRSNQALISDHKTALASDTEHVRAHQTDHIWPASFFKFLHVTNSRIWIAKIMMQSILSTQLTVNFRKVPIIVSK